MRIALFCHSLISDWNHGNAHFLRGIATELLSRGHDVVCYEPEEGWSLQSLVTDQGDAAVARFRAAFPSLDPKLYRLDDLDLDAALDGCDLVLVHEWNEPELIARIGRHRARTGTYRLFFHDSHHRAATRPHEIADLELDAYDGVLAFGRVVRDLYLERGWVRRSWVWHEAADTRIFSPLPDVSREADLVWIGNWGDDQRTQELCEFLLRPAKALELTGAIYGVRYPRKAQAEVADSGLEYRGWIANHDVPAAFAAHRVTVHVPRAPYVRLLPGVPTIRMFEALACGIPLVCSPWDDTEGLFQKDRDYLQARDGEEMGSLIKEVINDADLARSLAESGRETILAGHTCSHRVDELLSIYEETA